MEGGSVGSAARAYDWAAVQARGPDATRNFPGELISEPPVSLGDERGERKTSKSYTGVSWHKASLAWRACLNGHHIGLYASDEDAARAYDYAAVELGGPDAKRNFPDELISELPATRGDKRRERKA
jgi:hypothetical protein